MRLISHRGNTNGNYLHKENCRKTLDQVIKLGYDVEVDLWKIGEKLYLSHDKPNYDDLINESWLLENSDNLLVHAKNREALDYLLNGWNQRKGYNHSIFHYFSHENDKYAWTNRGYLIVFPGYEAIEHANVIIMMPEQGTRIPKTCYGICSDFVENYIGKV